MAKILSDLTGDALFSGVRGYVFDCDGVLVDSFGANQAYYNWFRQHFGLPPMTPEQEAFVHAHAVIPSLAHVLPPERLAEADALRQAFDYRDLLPHLRPEPGVTELLRQLVGYGWRLAVNTNRTTTMGLLVDHFGWHGLFDPVMTAGQVAHPKPHPESMERILAAWGARPEEVVFLGDSVVDEETARRSGVRFWAYKNAELEAELLVPDFPSLGRRLERWHRPDGGPDRGQEKA